MGPSGDAWPDRTPYPADVLRTLLGVLAVVVGAIAIWFAVVVVIGLWMMGNNV